MSSSFYLSIIEEEKKAFNFKEETLKKAAKDVAKSYSTTALKDGSTFLDYNLPQNRCAYLYKYATIHTGMVTKYFKNLIEIKKIKNIFKTKKDIKICCLGGGPGTDIVGIFKSLANFQSLHKKVVQVTVLDICGGWRNSFKHIVSRLKHGKVDGVPATFIDSNNFKADLIEVNLLRPLSANVVKLISSADAICMVKFVSAIIGKQESIDALKVIGNNIKLGATILYIDNFHKKVHGPLENISKECGFGSVFGPLEAVYKCSQTSSKTTKTLYGCLPTNTTRVFVIGWIKTSEAVVLSHISDPGLCANSNDDDSWDTESDSEDSYAALKLSDTIGRNFKDPVKLIKPLKPFYCDKFTQTEVKYFCASKSNIIDKPLSADIAELPALIEALSDLLSVMEVLGQKSKTRTCYC